MENSPTYFAMALLLPLILAACGAITENTSSADGLAMAEPLYCETHGAGRPLIFLHGFGAHNYTWRYLTDALAEGHKVILVDLKGHGRSPKPQDGKYSVQDHAALITELIVDNGWQDATLVGHSFGGGVALLTALNLQSSGPNRLHSLILIDTIAYRQSLPAFMKVLRTPVLGRFGVYVLPETVQARAILELAYYDDTKITDVVVEAYAAPLKERGAKYALLQTANSIIPPNIDDIARSYRTLQLPTLILWGAHDEIIPLRIGEQLNADLPDSTMSVFERSGHIPHEEQPAEVINRIVQFLSRPPGDGQHK